MKLKIAKVATTLLLTPVFIMAEETPSQTLIDNVTISETYLKAEHPLVERQNSSSTKIIITKEEIVRYGDQTMGDILKRLPGLTFTGPAGYVEDIRFRGADKGYTQILIDGEPIADGKADRQMQVSRLSSNMIERIEIIKQTTAEFNSDGVAGTINIILKNPPKKATGSYSLSYGASNGEPIKEGYLSFGDTVDKLGYTVALNKLERPHTKPKTKEETTYKDNANQEKSKIVTEDELEVRKNTEKSINPKVTYKIDDEHKVIVSGYYIDGTEEKDVTKTAYEDGKGTIGIFGDHADDKKTNSVKEEIKDRVNGRVLTQYEYTPTLDQKYTFTAMANKGAEDKEVSETKIETKKFNTTPTSTTTVATEDSKITETENKVKADAAFVILNANYLKVGTEYAEKTFEAEKSKNNVQTTSPKENIDTTEKSLNAYVLDEINIGSHVLTPGVRFESFKQESAYNLNGQDEIKEGKYNFTNPSLHYLWQVTDSVNIRSSIAKKIKKPKFDEIYAGIVDTTVAGTEAAPYETGNLDLRPEKSLGYELGAEYFLPEKSGVLSVNTYLRKIEDKIEKKIKLGSDGYYYKAPENVGEATLKGIEFDGSKKIAFIDGFTLLGNLTFMDATVVEDGVKRDLKDVPEYAFNLGFDQKFASIGLTVGAGYNKLGKITGTGGEETVVGKKVEASRTIIDVYALKEITKSLDIRLSGKNITDVEKVKYEEKYYDSGNLKTIKNETEDSQHVVMLSLEGRF